ncbi:MAG TPA: hypothetical protein VEB59_06045, partial [Gemmatimonadales bacterium]|nr:hypothetical protein [Gemmatimonadales bacterium]
GVVGPEPDAPITLETLRPALKQRYADQLAATLTQSRQRQLARWVDRLGAEATPTQERLAKIWKITQPGVSLALKDLGQAGYVIPLPRRSGEATTYAFTGAARLIFG